MKTDTTLRVSIRWMIRRDLESVLEIERASFEQPLTEEEFCCALRQRNCIGMVAEHKEHVVGFFVYELHPHHIELLNLAVCPEWRSEGVGTACIDKLEAKLFPQHRNRIVADVSERNLSAQKFFAAMGFKAVNVLNGLFTTDESAYRFVFRVE